MRKLLSPPPLRNVRQAVEKLELLELTAGGALTLLGEKIQLLHFDIEVSVSLVTGALLGVGHQLALLLAATSCPRFVKNLLD